MQSCRGALARRRWALLWLIRASMPLGTARRGGGRCSSLCASTGPALQTADRNGGQASRPGERRIITMVNTHETVASIGLDNSHDALLPLAWRQVRRAARFPPLQAWSAFTRAARFPRSCLARRCRSRAARTPPYRQLVLINLFYNCYVP